MLLTEEQARTKWCPHASQAAVVCNDSPVIAVSANRDAGNHYGVENCNCLASGCMAWRWGASTMVTRRVYSDAPDGVSLFKARFKEGRNKTFFEFDGAWWSYEHSSSDTIGRYDLIVRSEDEGGALRGFCGLAGRMEG